MLRNYLQNQDEPAKFEILSPDSHMVNESSVLMEMSQPPAKMLARRYAHAHKLMRGTSETPRFISLHQLLNELFAAIISTASETPVRSNPIYR